LREQYTDIWNYAATLLSKQFPFLDPNVVQKAKQDDLNECYHKIKMAFMPVYLRPFSEAQVEQIKQRWDKLRYVRVDLWLRLSSNSKTPAENRNTPVSNVDLDYELTQKSLSQLLGLVWMIVPQRPEYYLNALEKQKKFLELRVQSKHNARIIQQHLEKKRSIQMLQIEHISFMLAALLETPKCLEGNASIITKEQRPLEQHNKTTKGGDTYELNNSPDEKS
jgi:hypothetical protein